ncbi:MAG: gliding motility-associated C-terminal domain-containing protein [Bacteroidota bacterium]
MIAGQSYDVSFFAGFNSGGGLVSSSPVEFALYGKADCSNIPAPDFDCFEGFGWTELGTFTASGTNGTWVQVTGTFTAPFDVAALAFSKSCAFVAGPDHSASNLEYHFMDALEITGAFDGVGCGPPPPDLTAELSGDCVSGYTLTATPDDAVDYQWYLDGVAIVGATDNPWDIDPVEPGEYQVLATFADGECAISDPIVFNPDLAVLDIDATVTNPGCFGESTGSIELDIDSPNSPFDINWNTGSDEVLLENLDEGTYSVTVTDANGCFGTFTTTLTQPDEIFVDVQVEQPTANQGSNVDIFPSGGTPPFQYEWDNGLAGPNQMNLDPGTYSVTITDDNGCEEIVEIEIFEPLLVDILVFPEICLDACDGSVELTVEGGLGPYTFDWSNSGTTSTLENLCEGLYSVTVTDDFGTAFTEFIQIDPGITFTLDIVEDGTRCTNQETTTLDLSVNGGEAPYDFDWSTGATSEDLTGVTTGSYDVEVTDAQGCVSTATIDVPPINALAVTPLITNISCGAAEGSIELVVNGGQAPYDFLWEDGQTGSQIFNLPPDTYAVTITDALGCFLEEAFTVVEQDQLSLDADVTDVACLNENTGAIDLSINGGATPLTIAWSNGLASEDISDLSPGDYTVTVTDANGCEEISAYTIITLSSFSSTADITDVSCFAGADGAITVNPLSSATPLSFSWSTLGNTATVENLAAGTYDLTITDNLGCVYTSSYDISEPALFQVDSIVQPNLCFGDSAASIQVIPQGADNFIGLWSTGATGLTLNNLTEGDYALTVTNDANCEQTYSFSFADNPPLAASTAEVLPACGDTNGSLSLSPSGGQAPYTFLWSTGATTANLSGIATGNYDYTITDALGCALAASVFLAEESSASLSSTLTAPICPGDTNGAITLELTGGAPPFTINWSTGDDGLALTDLAAGTYSANITDANGCNIFQEFTLAGESSLSLATAITDVSCFGGDDGVITVTPNGSAPGFTYNWSTGGNANQLSNLSAGNYELSITDALGCTYVSAYDITEAALFDIDSVLVNNLCAGDSSASIVITPSTPGTYNAIWNTGTTGLSLQNLIAGDYSVAVSNQDGCVQAYDFSLSDQPPLELNFSFTDPRCGQANGTINVIPSGGVPPYTINWSNGATGDMATDLSPGDYTVSVFDANACLIEESFTLSEASSLDLSATVSPATCFGEASGAIVIDAISNTTNLSYLWSNGAEESNLTDVSAGNYSLTITDALGCEYLSEYEVTAPPLFEVDTQVSPNACFGESDASIELLPLTPDTYDVVWNSGQNELLINGLAAGTYTATVSNSAGCEQVYDFTLLDEIPLLTADLSAVDPSCGIDNGSLTANVEGGTPPYTYNWSTGAATADITDLPPGLYSLEITDAAGCFTSVQTELLPSAGLSVSAQVQEPACNGTDSGSIELTPSAGTEPYAIVWSTGETGASLQNLTAGSYTATITDVLGCELIETFVLDEPPVFSFTSTTNPAPCFGELGSATVTPAGGTLPYTIAWSSGDTALAVDLAAGSYTFLLSDANGCTQAGQLEITEPLVLEAEFTLEEGPTTGQNDGTISAIATGGTPPYTFAWSNGDSGSTITNLAPGPYTLTVTDDNGCTLVLSTTLPTPPALEVSFEITDNPCFGDCTGEIALSVTGGEPPYNIIWSDGQTGLAAINLCSDTYTVTIDDANGNTVSLSDLNVQSPPELLLVGEVSPVSCVQITDGTITSEVSGGTAPYSYNWNTGAATPELSQLAAGTYTLEVTDANACQVEEVFIVPDYVPLAVDFTTDVTNCSWDEFQLALVSPFSTEVSYLLNGERVDFGTTGIVNNLPPGSYAFSYQEPNGCEVPIAEFDFLVEPPYDIFVDESPRNLEYGDNLILDIQVTPESQLFLNNEITWTTQNSFECVRIFEDDCTEIFMSPTESEVVRMRFVDERGCERSFAIPIFVKIPDYVYVPNVFSPNGDGANDDFAFFITDFVVAVPEVQIFDRWGAAVYEDYDLDPTNLRFWDGRFRGQAVNPGVYVYTILLELVTGEQVLLSGDVTVVR